MDGQARALLEKLAALAPATPDNADDARWLSDFRYKTALLAGFGGAAVPLDAVSHVSISGDPPVTVRLYRPGPGLLPLLLHMHGGGAIAGSVDGHDACLRALAQRTGWLVAAPFYRLAPEHPFPAQLDDGWQALTGLAERADALGIDARRIVVSGDSIGGTLATALAMRAHKDGPNVAGQILLYPNTDLRREASYPSRASENGNVIALPDLERQIAFYLAHSADRNDFTASPILAATLAGSPRTLLVTCGADPLRDEGEAYGQKLVDADVEVRSERFPGMVHAFLQMGGHVDATARLLDLIVDWLG
jgi:acetyl esterase